MLNSDSNMNAFIATTTTSSSFITTRTANASPTVEEQTEVNETPPDPFEILRNECYERLNQSATSASTALNIVTDKFCPGTFDGWLCWPDTPAGTSAYERCPEFITGFDPLQIKSLIDAEEDGCFIPAPYSPSITNELEQSNSTTSLPSTPIPNTPASCAPRVLSSAKKKGYAHKDCDSNGNWFKHPLTNKTWSNYTTCVNIDDLEWKHKINLIYEVGYGVSLVAILLSLAILGYFKSLKCARITLHMNLFTSFAVNNSLWLLWYSVVMPDAELLHQNPPICVVLHVILQYFLLTNYSWMLCEGFYLHTVLVSAFISEKKLVKWLIAFGWGSPGVVTFIYALARGLVGSTNDNVFCWMNQTKFENILVVPVCISMFLNLLFLCNIVRVVLLKMKAPASLQNSCGPSRTVLQAFRATLLLVPLLGLQYILTPFRPDPLHPWEHTYEVISAFTASFQGLCVATFFCFFNGEVIAQVKRKWRTVFLSNRQRANSYTATQVSFVRCGPAMPGEEKV